MKPTISHNTDKNGIEISFSERPQDAVLTFLKSKKFRWSKYTKVWYNKFSEDLFQEMLSYFETDASEAGEKPLSGAHAVQPVARINIYFKDTVNRGVLRDEIEAGKMLISQYQYFDGMTDGYQRIPDDERTWSDKIDDRFARQLSSTNERAYIWNDGTIHLGDYFIKYKDDITIPESFRPKRATEADMYVDLYLKPEFEEFDLKENDSQQPGIAEGTRVEMEMYGRKVCGKIIKVDISRWTMRPMFGAGPVETTTRYNYDVELDNGVVTSAYQFRVSDQCTSLEPSAIYTTDQYGKKRFMMPDLVWQNIHQQISDRKNAIKRAESRRKAEFKHKDMVAASKYRERAVHFMSHYLGWELNNMEFSRKYITGESENEQKARIDNWQKQLNIVPVETKLSEEFIEKLRSEREAENKKPENSPLPKTLSELVPYYNAQPDEFSKNKAITDFTYQFAGPLLAPARHLLLLQITGQRIPKPQAGISRIEKELKIYLGKKSAGTPGGPAERPSDWIKPGTAIGVIETTLKLKHTGTTIENLNKQFELGKQVEKEHAKDDTETLRIVFDHLWEDPEYYTKAKPENWAEKEIEAEAAKKEVSKEIEDENVKSDKAVGSIRPDFLKKDIVLGREIQISMPNGEKHRGQFAIVELKNIIASHNEENFHSEAEYPKNSFGNNINDRNYKDDPAAQMAVMDYAKNLEPERLITTSRTPSGTPIVSADGFVVSGNNRTMSLKLAVKQDPEKYKEYVKYLAEEAESFGFTKTVGSALLMKDRIPLPGSSFHNPLSVKFENPVLIRIDYDFPEYSTQELAKYNKDTKKAERPVDKAIKLSNILRENERCAEIIAEIAGEYDTLTEFYANTLSQKKFAKTLTDCNLLTSQELPAFFTGSVFTETGKEFIENLLAALILDRDALVAAEQPGVKVLRQRIITALPVLMKNSGLPEGKLTEDINKAVILQQTIRSSGNEFNDWIRQQNLFGDKYSKKVVYLNRLLNEGKFIFKNAIESYNQSVMQNQGASLFGDKPGIDEIFDKYIKGAVSATESRLIEASDLVQTEGSVGSFAGQVPEDIMRKRFRENEPIKNVFEKAGQQYPGKKPDEQVIAQYEEIKDLSVADLRKMYSTEQLDDLIKKLEDGARSMVEFDQGESLKKINELIGKVIDARNMEKPAKPAKIVNHKDLMQFLQSQGIDMFLVPEEQVIRVISDNYDRDNLPPASMLFPKDKKNTIEKLLQFSIIIEGRRRDPWDMLLWAYATYKFISSAEMEFKMTSQPLAVFEESYRDEHKAIITKALAEGKHIDKNVLAEYPEDFLDKVIDHPTSDQAEKYKERYLRSEDGSDIFLVDGNAVRKDHIEFTMGGHGYVYDWIPKGKIYIDENLEGKNDDLEAVIRHEVFEVRKMRDEGMTYEDAHEMANQAEQVERNKKSNEADMEPTIDKLYEKYGKITNKAGEDKNHEDLNFNMRIFTGEIEGDKVKAENEVKRLKGQWYLYLLSKKKIDMSVWGRPGNITELKEDYPDIYEVFKDKLNTGKSAISEGFIESTLLDTLEKSKKHWSADEIDAWNFLMTRKEGMMIKKGEKARYSHLFDTGFVTTNWNGALILNEKGKKVKGIVNSLKDKPEEKESKPAASTKKIYRITKDNAGMIAEKFLNISTRFHVANDGYFEEDLGVIIEFGKYGYDVNQEDQEDDLPVLQGACKKFNNSEKGDLVAFVERSDTKFNTVTISDLVLIANNYHQYRDVMEGTGSLEFAKEKLKELGLTNERYDKEKAEQKVEQDKKLDIVRKVKEQYGLDVTERQVYSAQTGIGHFSGRTYEIVFWDDNREKKFDSEEQMNEYLSSPEMMRYFKIGKKFTTKSSVYYPNRYYNIDYTKPNWNADPYLNVGFIFDEHVPVNEFDEKYKAALDKFLAVQAVIFGGGKKAQPAPGAPTETFKKGDTVRFKPEYSDGNDLIYEIVDDPEGTDRAYISPLEWGVGIRPQELVRLYMLEHAKPKNIPKQLPVLEFNGKKYYVDFRLQQLRDVETAIPIEFRDIKSEELKAAVRFVRSGYGPNVYMAGIDDTTEPEETEVSDEYVFELWKQYAKEYPSQTQYPDYVKYGQQKGLSNEMVDALYAFNARYIEFNVWTKYKAESIEELNRMAAEDKEELERTRPEREKMVEKLGIGKSAPSIVASDYKNDFELNKAIEALLDKKWNDDPEKWTEDELEFIGRYSGYGGLDEFGQIDKGSLFEFFTPEKVIEKMWGLAYKYGYNEGPIMEPSCGTGLFFKREYVKSHIPKFAVELNKYSTKITKLLYPEVNINNGKDSMYFEQLFIRNNYTVRDKVTPTMDLVIGNPPYGEAQGLYLGMGEKTYSHAKNYIDYFIFRGLDMLRKDGLLIYIIGAEVAGGGIPWLDQGTSKCKELIAKKGKLIDAYRLPEGMFARTNVVSDIIVFRKR